MAVALECKKLNKSYGRQKVLQDVAFSLEENKIYGLLGRNGAGKSTLLNIISCLIIKNSGDIYVMGEEVFENSKAVENICFVREKGFPVEDYKVNKIFKTAQLLYKDWDEDYKNLLVREFKLNTKKKYKNLSTGTKSIVGLIIGLASRARITIFDEPSLGLDAAARDKFYSQLLQDYQNYKRTIIISTHLIDEVSNLFEEVIILNDMKIMLKEDLQSLLEKAHFLNGRKDNILPYLEGKQVLHKEIFGSNVIMGVMGEFKQDELDELYKNNVAVSPIPLQKLFIYLTDNENN